MLLGFLAGRYYPGDFDLYDGIVVLAFIISPIVLFARHRLNAAISTGLMLTFFVIIAFVPIRNIGQSAIPDFNAVYSITMVLICILPLILLLVAPAKVVSGRLIFLAIGLLLLIALNELSKLGLDVTAPKLNG